MAFSLPVAAEKQRGNLFLKVLKRSFLIFIIGIVLNWSPFVRWDQSNLVVKAFANVRIFGVLQRIALAYLIGSIIILFTNQGRLIWSLLTILLGYWALTFLLGDSNSPYSLEGFWGTSIDRYLLGSHIYKGEGVPFDPEGLASTIGSVAQVLIGYLAGQFVIRNGSDYSLTTKLFVAGTLLVFGGFCWDLVFPINKKIWTSSYVVYTSGIALLILALLIYFIHLRQGRNRVTRFFEVFGKNPLFIFVLSGFLPRLLGLIRIPNQGKYLSPFGWIYEHVCRPIFSNPLNASLSYAVIMVVFYWLIAYFLDKRKVYIKV